MNILKGQELILKEGKPSDLYKKHLEDNMKKLTAMCCLICVIFLSCNTINSTQSNNRSNTAILGELYTERNAGFSMRIPSGWRIRNLGQMYPSVESFSGGDRIGVILFVDTLYYGSASECLDETISTFPQLYTDYEIIERGDFETIYGIKGVYITIIATMYGQQTRIRSYFFKNEENGNVLGISCNTRAYYSARYDAIFDECVKTFMWLPVRLGELYVERDAGFSMYIPKNWSIRDLGQKYSSAVGFIEGEPSMIDFAYQYYSGQISDYINEYQIMYPESTIIKGDTFETINGLRGEYITVHWSGNDFNFKQNIYIFLNENNNYIMAIFCTTSATLGTRYDAMFDKCVKTFSWLQ